jgi:hypothetical protein
VFGATGSYNLTGIAAATTVRSPGAPRGSPAPRLFDYLLLWE